MFLQTFWETSGKDTYAVTPDKISAGNVLGTFQASSLDVCTMLWAKPSLVMSDVSQYCIGDLSPCLPRDKQECCWLIHCFNHAAKDSSTVVGQQ